MNFTMLAIEAEGKSVNHRQQFVDFLNQQIDFKHPGWLDSLESRLWVLATDYAQRHGGQVELETTPKGKQVLLFNFTGLQFTKPLREVVPKAWALCEQEN